MQNQRVEVAIGRLRAAEGRMKRAYLTRLKTLVGDTYTYLVQISAFDTGAYVNSHQVVVGGQVAYDPPNRPEPNERFPAGVAIFERPDAAEAADEVMRALGPGLDGVIKFRNQRYYARFLELGTSRMAPRRTYGLALDFMRVRARELAVRPGSGGRTTSTSFDEVEE